MSVRETAKQIANLLKLVAPWTATDADDAAVAFVSFNLESDEAWGYIERFISALTPEQKILVKARLEAADLRGLPIWLIVLIQLILKFLTDDESGSPATSPVP